MEIMRIGLLGPGRIAKKFADAANACEGVKLQAVASRSQQRSQDFADEFGIPLAFNSYDDLINSPEVDVVYICVPNVYHAELAMKAMKAGKPVLCEKPFGLNVKETKEAVDYARENKILLMEAMWTRTLPVMETARKWIAEGRIGEVRNVKSSFSFCADPDPEGRYIAKNLGGGAMWDVGIYGLAFAMDFAGCAPSKVSGFCETSPAGVDYAGVVALQFPNGVLGELNCGHECVIPHDAGIYGTKGYIEIPNYFAARECIFFDRKYHEVERVTDPIENGFRHEIMHFRELYYTGKTESPLYTLDDTLVSAKVCEDLLREWKVID